MATVKPLKPKKPVDYVGFEPVMCAVSKARAAQHLLEFLDSGHEGPLFTFKTRELERAKDHLAWIRDFGHNALTAALDEIEIEYRKLGTNLLQKEFAQAEVERLLRSDLTTKDGA
jgi:hypothetical protein